jgi:probable F420-dependent oxidoreductase
MHIGLSRPPTPPHPLPDVDGALVARLAEEHGFEAIFYGEHPITPVGDPGQSVHSKGVPFFQDTLVMLARASAVTSRITLGAGVFLIPIHQPVMFAKHLASLDYYSGGRLVIGAGVGWSRVEIEVMGGNFDRRWGQTREAIEVMKALWTQDVAEYHGEFFDVPPVSLYPKPASKPWPPFLLPGPMLKAMITGEEGGEQLDSEEFLRSFRRIARFADGWFPARMGPAAMRSGPPVIAEGRRILARLCEEAGRNPSELQTTVLLRTQVHDGDLIWPELVSRDVLRAYEDVGVERCVVTIPTITSEEHAREVVERMAEALL